MTSGFMKRWILRILDENRPNLNFRKKILGISNFDGVFFANCEKEMTIITYTGSFKYIEAIFFVLGTKTNIARTAAAATTTSTHNFDSLSYLYPRVG